MKSFCRALLVLILTIGLVQVVASDTVYFLVAELPDRVVRNDSYVLPLSKEEDINYARYLISRYGSGYAADDRTIVVANVAAAKDNINRNFLDTKLPKWSWQISQFLGFAEITAEVLDGNPTQLEPFDGSHGGRATIGFWDYTVVKELGSVPLYLSIVPDGQNLQFYWSGVGTNDILDRKSTRLNSSHTVISTLSLHDALPIYSLKLLPKSWTAIQPNWSRSTVRTEVRQQSDSGITQS